MRGRCAHAAMDCLFFARAIINKMHRLTGSLKEAHSIFTLIAMGAPGFHPMRPNRGKTLTSTRRCIFTTSALCLLPADVTREVVGEDGLLLQAFRARGCHGVTLSGVDYGVHVAIEPDGLHEKAILTLQPCPQHRVVLFKFKHPHSRPYSQLSTASPRYFALQSPSKTGQTPRKPASGHVGDLKQDTGYPV